MIAPTNILFGYGVRAVNKTQLAKMVGVSPATMCRWAKEPGLIPLKSLAKIARICQLKDEDIVKVVKGVKE